ncbi:MAG: protein translocase subunit SecD [Deltaproteobacteria bacterium]|nr:protein translocase subunit SecD [Candidatus Zymogenaceae bacterium]
MIKDLRIRFAIILVVLLGGLFYLMPTLSGYFGFPMPDFWKAPLPTKTLNLGLDLKGGMYLLLGVNLDEALDNSLDRMTVEIKGYLDNEKIPYSSVGRSGETGISVVITDPDKEGTVRDYIGKRYDYLDVADVVTNEGKTDITFTYNPKALTAFRQRTIEQTLETIRNRVDELGLAEPEITRQGDYDILIQLPGLSDPEAAKSLIKKVALLEFKLVDDKNDLDTALAGEIPEGDEILYEKVRDLETGRVIEEKPYLIETKTLMTGEAISDAGVRFDTSKGGRPYVQIEFNSAGEAHFAQVSGDNVGKRLAIILDNSVYSAPVIQTKITGGSAIITGNFNEEEAKNLAIVLRSGALPATITVQEERTVGPSLGADSIHKGFLATAVGLALVVLFMVLYYGVTGLVADTALILNFLIILAVLSAFQATLTLPGIAGIALTLGMAVDANVLINERIREELRLGKTPRAALEGGYDKAFATIMDANITTLIAGLVLFQFGTGPVKGFAVTLCIGIVATLFTAIFVTHSIFDFVMSRFRIKRLSI